MTWSLNELEALARKAAKGRGMTWGMAEETGKATRALCSVGLDGPVALAALLTAQDGYAHEDVAPHEIGAQWRAAGGTLCPIAAGCCLSDFATLLTDAPITLHAVAQPILLVPFAQNAARRIGQPVALSFGDVSLYATACEIRCSHALPDTADVTVTLCDIPFGKALPAIGRAVLSAETAQTLNRFAHRTYAPATEASRLAGAGAGLSDND